MSIATRIENISNHLKNAYDELQGLGADLTNVNKNIENLSMVLDDIYDSMPQVSGEDTNLTLNNTRIGKIKSTLKGNTSQDGTPTPTSPIPVNVVSGDNKIFIQGKNLFGGYDEIDITKLGIHTIASNDEITTSGTTNNVGWLFNTGNRPKIYLEAGTYTFSINNFIGTFPTITNVVLRDEAGTNIFDVRFATTLTRTFTISTNGSYYFDLYISTNNASFNSSFNIQIEKGNQATNYEPYQGNNYNIDLPVENLIDTLPTNTAMIDSGLTYTRNDDGSIQITGITNRSWDYTLTTSYTFEAGKTYTFSVDGISGKEVLYILFNSNNGGQLSANSSYPSASITIVETQTLPVKWSKPKGASVDLDLKIMIEEGSKQNSYTPYGTTPIEMCSSPDGTKRDYFLHDKTIDKWYWHKEIGKAVLNGGETWQVHGSIASWFYCDDVTDGYFNNARSDFALCNYFTQNSYSNVVSITNGQFVYGSPNDETKRLVIKNTDYTEVADFKTWLSTHNVTLNYQLATPTNTEITYQPLIDQLNLLEKAMSKEGQTNISQVNNDLPFIIKASALKKND